MTVLVPTRLVQLPHGPTKSMRVGSAWARVRESLPQGDES